VLYASLRLFPANGAKVGAPLPILAIEEEEPFARLESKHVSEVMRLVLGKRDLGAGFEPGIDEEALELGGHGRL
jgi:hypothetical protein